MQVARADESGQVHERALRQVPRPHLSRDERPAPLALGGAVLPGLHLPPPTPGLYVYICLYMYMYMYMYIYIYIYIYMLYTSIYKHKWNSGLGMRVEGTGYGSSDPLDMKLGTSLEIDPLSPLSSLSSSRSRLEPLALGGAVLPGLRLPPPAAGLIHEYICIYTHEYVCIYIDVYTYIYIYIYIREYLWICIYTYV